MRELATHKRDLRAELEADMMAWLANGNTVTQLATTRVVEYRAWTGTDAQAAKQLATAAELGVVFRMSEDKFLVLTRNVSFPQPYLYNHEPRWSRSEVKEWHINWRKG